MVFEWIQIYFQDIELIEKKSAKDFLSYATFHVKKEIRKCTYICSFVKKITEKIHWKLVRRVTVAGCYWLPNICPYPNSQNL